MFSTSNPINRSTAENVFLGGAMRFREQQPQNYGDPFYIMGPSRQLRAKLLTRIDTYDACASVRHA
jgi:hypothetical protein